MRKKSLFILLGIILAIVLIIAIIIPSSSDKNNTGRNDNSTGAEISEAPEPTPTPKPHPTTAPEGYFKDALFIGDSRTEGIRMCSELDGASFFCTVGMSVMGVQYEQASVAGYGTVYLSNLLKSGNFGKVYIMLGINDIGGDLDYIAGRYKEVVDSVREILPDAIIYVCSNLHVTANTNTYGVINNTNLDRFTALIRELANDEDIFFLDVNERFDNENGALDPKYSPDGVHLYADGYKAWGDWFAENAIVK